MTDGQISACPNCRSSDIRDRGPDWRCNDCTHTFETPVWREDRRSAAAKAVHETQLVDQDAVEAARDALGIDFDAPDATGDHA